MIVDLKKKEDTNEEVQRQLQWTIKDNNDKHKKLNSRLEEV